MAKGIAVVSGSNDVVFKALETGIVTIGSTLNGTGTYAQIGVSGSLSVSGSEADTRSFYVDENGVEINGSLDLTGDLSVTGNVFATLDISASQDLKAGRDLIAARNLDVEGTGNIKGKLTIQTGGLEVDAGETILADKLTVESNGIIVTGSSEFKDNVTIKGNLTVEGDTTVTVDTVSNMQIKDAIIHVGSGSSTAGKDLGLVFGSTLAKGFSVEDGIFHLGSTTSDATGASIDVSNDGELRLGILSASAGVYVDGRLEVTDAVVLGSDSSDVLQINSQVTASADVLLEQDVTMGTFDGAGTEASDLVKVVGSIRMPVFTTAGDPLTGSFPVIPADYVTNKANYNGYMFYLTGSDDTNWTTTDVNWLQANKWYFNERGDWHASFLFAE